MISGLSPCLLFIDIQRAAVRDAAAHPRAGSLQNQLVHLHPALPVRYRDHCWREIFTWAFSPTTLSASCASSDSATSQLYVLIEHRICRLKEQLPFRPTITWGSPRSRDP